MTAFLTRFAVRVPGRGYKTERGCSATRGIYSRDVGDAYVFKSLRSARQGVPHNARIIKVRVEIHDDDEKH
ncbi:MAG: hypothetical protein KDG54_11195 [Geminicoccaceae bacterium]|nr:hypothetical protein [Geminicoccaceae bacterium]